MAQHLPGLDFSQSGLVPICVPDTTSPNRLHSSDLLVTEAGDEHVECGLRSGAMLSSAQSSSTRAEC